MKSNPIWIGEWESLFSLVILFSFSSEFPLNFVSFIIFIFTFPVLMADVFQSVSRWPNFRRLLKWLLIASHFLLIQRTFYLHLSYAFYWPAIHFVRFPTITNFGAPLVMFKFVFKCNISAALNEQWEDAQVATERTIVSKIYKAAFHPNGLQDIENDK